LNRFSFRYAHVALPLLAGLFTHGCKPYGTHTREHSGNKAKAIHGADSAKSTIQKKLQPGIDRANVHRPIVGEPGQNVYGHVLTEMVRLGQHVNGVTDNPSPPLTGLQKALVIGIGYLHDDSDKNDLHGTLNDAAVIRRKLEEAGWTDITHLHDQDSAAPVTKPNIVKAMKALVHGAVPGDCFFFSFAGHGRQVKEDASGHEDDGKDEAIVTSDKDFITDDEMHRIMAMNLPEGVKITIIFDACHSGTAMDLPYRYDRQTKKFQEEPNPIWVPADVLSISGSMEDEKSYENHDNRTITLKKFDRNWISKGRVTNNGTTLFALKDIGVIAINKTLRASDKLTVGVEYVFSKKPRDSSERQKVVLYSCHGNLTYQLMQPNFQFLFHRDGKTVQEFVEKCDGKFGNRQKVQVTASQPSLPSRVINIDSVIEPNQNSKIGRIYNDGKMHHGKLNGGGPTLLTMSDLLKRSNAGAQMSGRVGAFRRPHKRKT